MKFFSNSRVNDRVLTWAMPVVLSAILILLAVLQYRWSRQASEATTTRMQASLQNSMMNFRLDLSREFATMSLELQGDHDPSINARNLAQKLDHWQRTSSLTGLIANVYEWNKFSDKNSALLHFVPSEGRVEPILWPSRFARLHNLLTAGDSDEALEPQGPHEEPDLDDALSGDQHPKSHRKKDRDNDKSPAEDTFMIGGIDEGIPALLIPASRNTKSTWLLVELNPQVLRERTFSQLANRYFGEANNSDYEVAVVTNREPRDHPQVLYSSDAGFGHNGQANIDATLNLFGPPALQGVPAPPPITFKLPASSRNLKAKPSSVSRTSAAQASLAFDGGIRFDPISYPQDETSWQIVVQHRKGSVAAAVAELRYRNLAISFGVLLVLAASMALIIFNSQRARRLAMLQMDFIAGVSHELRTPVAAILSISENIVDGVVTDEQQLLRYAGMIRNQSKRLHHLVEQVLRFAAMHREATRYTVARLRIAEVLDELLENMANLVSASGFVIERNIDPDLPPVEADLGVLTQCLENLITNAIKYGGSAKWIRIRASSKQQGLAREVWITVEDRGIGIDSEELEHIFEPFYRSPKVAESRVPGTGLGLSLAKSFAEAMQGRLTVTSEVGKCTTFTLALPAANENEKQRGTIQSSRVEQGG
jgi:two-component system, OmpR family, sensor histidine kinase SenX3